MMDILADWKVFQISYERSSFYKQSINFLPVFW